MILGGGAAPGSGVSSAAKEYYYHTGGGILPVHFHYYMGWFGVVIAAAITGIYMHITAAVNENSGSFLKCISVYYVSGFSRWYLYSPTNLLRGVMLFSVVYFSFSIFNSFTQKQRLQV